MKSSILIVSYLWKDTWSRWLEQPSSLLARLFVGALLVTVATVILIAFQLLERSVRTRLESFGLNTLIAREMIMLNDAELLPNQDRPDRLQPLQEKGKKLRLRQLYQRARTEWQNELQLFSYDSDALPVLAPWLEPGVGLICLSDNMPENSFIRITAARQSGDAIVKPFGNFFRPLFSDSVILVPRGWLPDVERNGFIEVTLFQRDETAPPMPSYISAINTLYSLEGRPSPQIQSSLPLIKELERLQSRQSQWRNLLAGLLGVALALVYGAIAVLEFRQNLFIGALLRSFGAPGIFLYLRQWLENAFLANVAAIGAIVLVASFHEKLFGTLGFPRSVLNMGAANPYWSTEIYLILLCVNAGALLSSLPVAIGLKKPVGAILN